MRRRIQADVASSIVTSSPPLPFPERRHQNLNKERFFDRPETRRRRRRSISSPTGARAASGGWRTCSPARGCTPQTSTLPWSPPASRGWASEAPAAAYGTCGQMAAPWPICQASRAAPLQPPHAPLPQLLIITLLLSAAKPTPVFDLLSAATMPPDLSRPTGSLYCALPFSDPAFLHQSHLSCASLTILPYHPTLPERPTSPNALHLIM